MAGGQGNAYVDPEAAHKTLVRHDLTVPYAEVMDSVQVRPVQGNDLPLAERASAVTFFEAEEGTRRVSDPEVEPRSAVASKQWIDRMRFFLSVDPQGCWVAVEADAGADRAVGFAGRP
ncbi:MULTISPECIES: hypothetical protein [unclassified Streptomyces]|uniref:hypothetical protein n=1 Tax=unclassified Streptomyces TaxID=2593676 RepID=UPI0037FA59DD